nr:inositol monophosphatase [Ornithinimicrobium flavum]
METTRMLSLLQQVAEEVINPRFRALAADEISSKTRPDDLVTVADREAEVMLTRELRMAYPDALVLGEEAFATEPGLVEDFRAAEHAFTVDPVDGTRNFVHGSPDHAVMVAEVRAGTTVRSWIWQPQHLTGFVAELGSGAYRVDAHGGTASPERLPMLQPAVDPAAWRVRTSARRWVGDRLGDAPPMDLTWVSCGIDYPKLVTGECDALVYRGTQPWDHVPGSLLLTEVGGFVGDLGAVTYGPRSRPDGIVAGASREIVQVLAPSVAARRR